MKQKASKLDEFEGMLDELFLQQKTLKEAQEELRLKGVTVSLSRLSDWWGARQRRRQEEMLLGRIASGARQCREVEKTFEKNPAPEVETLLKLHRVLILKLSTQSEAHPDLLDLVGRLMKPVLDWSKLMEKRRELELAEAKYRDEVQERKAAMEREIASAKGSGGITAETLERIERELKLL